MNTGALLTLAVAAAAAYLLYRNTSAVQANTVALTMGPYTVTGPASNYVPLNCPPGQYSGSDLIGRPMCLPLGAVS